MAIRQHEALAGVIKMRLATISLRMATTTMEMEAVVAAVVVILRCRHRSTETLVFRYQLVWMPKMRSKKQQIQ